MNRVEQPLKQDWQIILQILTTPLNTTLTNVRIILMTRSEHTLNNTLNTLNKNMNNGWNVIEPISGRYGRHTGFEFYL